MNSNAIRQSFIDYFKQREHLHLPSASLVPNSPDVTTLFTIAGMQQMIPYFLGREQPPSRRMVTVQKCVRTIDIEEVGDDSHLTFLEMLGNFSVGDYFKREAIGFTWEFATQTMGIAPDHWWAVVYPSDEEARAAWLAVGMPADRIGETEDNWWSQNTAAARPLGPQGPNSEIHFDRGPEHGCGQPDCRPEEENCDRFLEVWNDVFIQYSRDESGELRDLPWSNVDTGMGLERLAMVVQGVNSVYDTDLFQPIIRSVAGLSGKRYGGDHIVDRSLRIIADHCRASAFITADGVMPSAEGRGYVLRRLIRRAALHGRLLGIDRPFLVEPIGAVIDVMQDYWTELGGRREHVLRVVGQEERRFLQTLTRGLSIFEDIARQAEQAGKIVEGGDAFLLYDTHGFPLELTTELAQERGLEVDREGFTRELQDQRARARQGQKFRHELGASPEVWTKLADHLPPTVFTGYDELQTTADLVAIVADGHQVPRVEQGDQVEFVLATTPFYGEAGGQVGDTGAIRSDTGLARVLDTQRPVPSLIVHKAEVLEGTFSVGDVVEAEVDAERRLHILPHHSGTHLLHKALQEVLGPDATQAGSLVAPDRLRFDFRWPSPLTVEQIREVQDRVNAAIWANLPVLAQIEPYDTAIKEGAMALFGEKYGDRVRVVSMGEWSKELCGGTHVAATGDIGLLVITSESGIGSGIRRIEALAGAAAYAHVNDLRDQLNEIAELLEAGQGNAIGRLQSIITELREQDKRVASLTTRLATMEAESLVRGSFPVNGFSVVVNRISVDSVDLLHATTDAVKSKLDRGIVVLGTVVEGKPAFSMAVTRNLKGEGFDANAILREAARRASGGAGGTAEFAQGGGKDASKVQDVLETAVSLIKRKAEA